MCTRGVEFSRVPSAYIQGRSGILFGRYFTPLPRVCTSATPPSRFRSLSRNASEQSTGTSPIGTSSPPLHLLLPLRYTKTKERTPTSPQRPQTLVLPLLTQQCCLLLCPTDCPCRPRLLFPLWTRIQMQFKQRSRVLCLLLLILSVVTFGRVQMIPPKKVRLSSAGCRQ